MSMLNPPDASNEHGPEPSVPHDNGLPVTFSLAPISEYDPGQITVEPVQPVDGPYGRFGGRCLALRNVLSASECQYLISEMSAKGKMEPVRYRREYRQNDRCVFDSKELADVLWQRVEPIASTFALHADVKHPERQRLLEPTGAGGAEGAEFVEGAEGTEGAEGAGAGDGEGEECPEELRLDYGSGGVWRPVGLNEVLRFCRYNPGGFFRPHCDACFKRSEEEMSLFTCMFYLDGGFAGGATRFLRLGGVLTDKNYLQLAEDDQVLASLQPEAGMCLLFFQPGLLHEGEDVKEGSKHILRTDVMCRRDPGTAPKRTPDEEEAWRLVQAAQALEAASECDRACQLYRRAFKLDPKLERMF